MSESMDPNRSEIIRLEEKIDNYQRFVVSRGDRLVVTFFSFFTFLAALLSVLAFFGIDRLVQLAVDEAGRDKIEAELELAEDIGAEIAGILDRSQSSFKEIEDMRNCVSRTLRSGRVSAVDAFGGAA